MGVGVPAVPDEPPPPPPPPPGPPTSAAEAVQTLSGHFLGVSVRRAFRLHIRIQDVLPSERRHLEAQARHITDPDQQAFLAWRRSVLLLVALMFIPLTIMRFVESFDGPAMPLGARIFMLMPAVAELMFCVIAFDQLKNWAQWNKQRRVLFIAWALYFMAPFLVYVYPFRTAFDDTAIKYAQSAAVIGGVQLKTAKSTVHMVVGLAFGVQALLALGPKVVSLMPGLIRASIVTKLLFPGTSAPGWLMMLAAPLYALLAYIIVLLPYQVTGSWQFMVGNCGILLAQVFIGLAGRRLTMPLTTSESHHRVHRSWLWYIVILVVSAGFTVYGLADFISQLNLGPVRVVTSVMAFVSHVLLNTLIGTDAIVAAMAHFRRRAMPSPEQAQLRADAETKLDVFVG